MNSQVNNQQLENQQDFPSSTSAATATATASNTGNSAAAGSLNANSQSKSSNSLLLLALLLALLLLDDHHHHHHHLRHHQLHSNKSNFRPVFYDSNKRSSPGQVALTAASHESANKRARIDLSDIEDDSYTGGMLTPSLDVDNASSASMSSSMNASMNTSISTASQTSASRILIPTPISPSNKAKPLPTTTSNTPVNTSKKNKKTYQQALHHHHHPNLSNIKRYRSRSLPNVIFSALRRHSYHSQHRFGTPSEQVVNAVPSMAFTFPPQQPFFPLAHGPAHAHAHAHAAASLPPPLPPVSLQSLREIDLHEILKNPQLRHDILFDPQLQFRPNLDGERGRKKKLAVDKYWDDVQRECELYIVSGDFKPEQSRLPPLFQTLKEILISLLPSKDVDQVNEVMDIELLNQQLKNFAVDFVALLKWLAQIFKSHCAPMRDAWVDEMTLKFVRLKETSSVTSLVDGLRMIFSILELMKLDVANHQIRILRPVLVETLVDFERNYFTQMITRCKLNLHDSTDWIVANYKQEEAAAKGKVVLKELCTKSILKLLSCRHMVTQFPGSLSFDHARLVLLRAEIRQLVCLQLCVLLYKQMVHQHAASLPFKQSLLKPALVNNLKREVLAIVTDDNGNVKWTRNVRSILLQLCKLCVQDPGLRESTAVESLLKAPPSESMVEFLFNWLLKQTQPSSQVYGIMEEKIFQKVGEFVNNSKEEDSLKEEATPSDASCSAAVADEDADLNLLGSKVAKLCNFHWSVFGSTYTDAVQLWIQKK